jgi:hypothetical protein
MAKVILSPAISQASGGIGGMFFSTGPAGPFMATKGRPHNQESNAQLGIRANFSRLSKRWSSTLTPAQQAAWITLSSTHQVHDALGQLVTLTGIQFYIKLNGSLLAIGQPIIDAAPGAVSCGAPGLLTVTPVGGGSPSLTVATNVAPAGNEAGVVWAIHPIRIGQKAILRHMILAKFFAPGVAGPYDITAEWANKYGLLFTGAVIALKVQFTNSDTGFQGVPSLGTAVAT